MVKHPVNMLQNSPSLFTESTVHFRQTPLIGQGDSRAQGGGKFVAPGG